MDPANVIRDSFQIEGIGLSDCRTIFLGWILELPEGVDSVVAAQAMLQHYAHQPQDHPMTVVLREAVDGQARARRRGGAMGRRSI
ncbi:MAG: hypothetical protein AAF557_04790 [Pseudomonadota bacterium]